MTKYEELKKVICEALPRLKNRVNGFIIQSPRWNVFSRTYEKDVYDDYVVFNYNVYDDSGNIFCKSWEIDKEFYQLEKCILGIDPTLSDVLEWSQNIQENDATLNRYGLWFTDDITWDLSKPLLKDQSEELIDYLISIKSQS